jgi:elongation factor Ts
MGISAADVKELRERTGAGMMDCKRALEETDGNVEAAIDLLRSRGAAKAAKRAGREASEGTVAVHVEGGVGALVELNCETDFVARNDTFQSLARQLAQHVARNASEGLGSGEEVAEQPFLGGDASVGAVVTEASATTGENVVLRRFARFEATDGALGSYVHMTGRIGVLVEVDGSAGENAARDVAMHIAAARPLAVTSSEIPADVVQRERAVYLEQVRQEGKPEHIQEKIVEGKLRKFYQEQTLMEQAYVKDPDRTVAEVLGGATVRRFARFELGE